MHITYTHHSQEINEKYKEPAGYTIVWHICFVFFISICHKFFTCFFSWKQFLFIFASIRCVCVIFIFKEIYCEVHFISFLQIQLNYRMLCVEHEPVCFFFLLLLEMLLFFCRLLYCLYSVIYECVCQQFKKKHMHTIAHNNVIENTIY